MFIHVRGYGLDMGWTDIVPQHLKESPETKVLAIGFTGHRSGTKLKS